MVPFRLTHNMVAAMGPMGYEGIFRKSMEATLRVMKQVSLLLTPSEIRFNLRNIYWIVMNNHKDGTKKDTIIFITL